MSVHLSAVGEYNVDVIKANIERGMEAVGINPTGRSAVIKPNIVQAREPESGIVTHPYVVEAIIRILQEKGFENIMVAETPALGVDWNEAFRVSGFFEMVKRTGTHLVDLFKSPRTNVNTGYGYSNLPNVYDQSELSSYECGYMAIPSLMLESDLYINVGKLKTHNRTGVTLTMKNQWALLSFKDRQMYHRIGLHEPIAQLAKAVRPQMTVVDGIIGLEGNGPILGQPKPVGALLVGRDMVETDIVGTMLMGHDPQSINHLRLAIEAGLGRWETDVQGERVESLAKPFIPAPQDLKKTYNLYLWRNHRACHLDDEAFSDALKIAKRTPRYWPFIAKLAYYMLFRRIDIVRGRGNRMPEFKKGQKIIVSGDCAKDLLQNYEELPANVVHVPGCPPDPINIINTIMKM